MLISSKCDSLVTVNPIFLATLASIWIISRSDPLEWDHDHISNLVTCCIKMTTCWCFLVIGQNVASMLVESILCSPGGLSHIDIVRTDLTVELIDDVLGTTIYGRLNLPQFSSLVAFVGLGGIGAMETHHACSSTLVTFFESSWLPF